MQVIVAFLVGLSIMLFLMLKTKLGPFMSMLFGALITGIGCGITPLNSVNYIVEGFANTCKGLALVVIFGTILGNYLEKSNACQRIATSMLRLTGDKNAGAALATTGYIVSIPVFSDVGLIMLSPIVKAVSKRTRHVVCVFATLTASALLCTNAYVAPTPAPLSIVAILNVDIGQSIICGLIVAAVSTIAAWAFCMLFLDKKPADYFTASESNNEKEMKFVSEDQMPSFTAAICPIALPLLLIILNSVCGMVLPADSSAMKIIGFIGDKNIALVIGILSAVLLLKKNLPASEVESIINDSLKVAGPIIFITCSGGAFAKVVEVTGIGEMIANTLSNSSLPTLLIPFLITGFSKFVLGNGAVAVMLGASLTLPLINAGLISPIISFLAISAGSQLGSHVNNSFFWVFAEFFGYDTKTTLKTLCVMQNVVLAGTGLICTLLISIFLH